MERRKRTLFAVLIATIIVVAVFSSFAINLFGRDSYEIRLPDLSQDSTENQPGDEVGSGGQFVRVEVSPQTVQSVVATLVRARPQSYYREITIELWAGETSSVTTAQVWVDGGWTRSDITSPSGMVQHNLVGEDTRWLWYDDDPEAISFPVDQTVSDLIQRIPTYEDVLALPVDEITDTGYEDYGGLNCVFAAAERDVGELLGQVQSHDLLKFGIIPELIGRLPVVTSLESLKRDDLVRILTEPKNALTKQYKVLLNYDGVQLEFEPDALGAIADKAIEMKIGARGLRSVMEQVMTGIMYKVPSDPSIEKVVVTADCVRTGTEPMVIHKSGAGESAS